MSSRYVFVVLLVAVLFGASAYAGANDQRAASSTSPQPMTPETRMMVIRSLNAEFVFARRMLPRGMKGLTIKNGVVTPSEAEVEQLAASAGGPAAKPGERAQITNILIKDRSIRLEINGGPKKKTKWYQHMQVGVGGAQTQSPEEREAKNPKGSYVDIEFNRFVPEMSGDQIRQLLSPVLDFKAKSAAEAYIETIPPAAREAIKNHQVLVGMNREMVGYAKGKPDRKLRERDSGTEYEEWIYGQPPQEVQFVRFVGDQVVRLEIMKVDGDKVVRTQKEVDLGPAQSTVAEKKEAKPRPAKAPTLRRPGDEPDRDSPMQGPDRRAPLLSGSGAPSDRPPGS
jgi:hypothetical protein